MLRNEDKPISPALVKLNLYKDYMHGTYRFYTHFVKRIHVTYAYRFKVKQGPSLVIATDHEARPGPHNDSLISFAKHCDLLVHDGQYFAEEYKDHQDWGHSSVDAALDNGIQCKAKSVLLTHHSPQRTDKMIETYKKDLKKQSKFKNLDFDFAKESIIYPVGKK